MFNSPDKTATVSSRITEALKLRKMRQIELSVKSGVCKESISRYISGAYEPKQEALYKMGKALNVSEMWLAGYDVPMERQDFQKENDPLSDIKERLHKEKDFRQLIIKINHLKPEQLDIIHKLLDQIIEFTPAEK